MGPMAQKWGEDCSSKESEFRQLFRTDTTSDSYSELDFCRAGHSHVFYYLVCYPPDLLPTPQYAPFCLC